MNLVDKLTTNPFLFFLAQLGRVNTDSTFRTTIGDVHYGCFPTHQ